jgi:putative FmdB family regulatory protein
MPTYEYKCSQCGHALEERQKITDQPLTQCPKCKKEALQRGLGGGAATLRFIGSGFYINDYANKEKSGDSCCPCGKNKTDCNES